MSAGRRVLERIGAIVMPMLAAGLVLVAVRGLASTLAGGGPLPNGGNLRSDCYVYADVAGSLAPSTAQFLRCTDGDPTCDQDRACNGTCLFSARVCLGLTSKTRCTTPPCPQSPTVCDTPPCPPVCQPPPSLDTLALNPRCPLEAPASLDNEGVHQRATIVQIFRRSRPEFRSDPDFPWRAKVQANAQCRACGMASLRHPTHLPRAPWNPSSLRRD